MASAKFDIPAGIVVHPVYGAGPTVSGIAVPVEAIRRGARLYGDEEFFPGSVLVADTRKQNYSVYPKKYYVDVLNECLSCGAPFVFFAQEQKHWYETLRLHVATDCLSCSHCRAQAIANRQPLKRLSNCAVAAVSTGQRATTWVGHAVVLMGAAVLRKAFQALQGFAVLRKRPQADLAKYPRAQGLAR